MQIHDHLALGKALAEAYFADRGALCRLAFVLGNIAPDLTATTHLRGHLHDRNTWGHSYANALPVIRRLSRALERHADGGLHDCYRLGVLLHYTADAFTWPHNEHFGGSLREHMRYERRLHKEIAARLSRESFPDAPRFVSTEAAHERYAALEGRVETDADYILAQTAQLAAACAHYWSRLDADAQGLQLQLSWVGRS